MTNNNGITQITFFLFSIGFVVVFFFANIYVMIQSELIGFITTLVFVLFITLFMISIAVVGYGYNCKTKK